MTRRELLSLSVGVVLGISGANSALALLRRERHQEIEQQAESDLLLLSALEAHPLLLGPEDFPRNESLQIGPKCILPKNKSASGGIYYGWD